MTIRVCLDTSVLVSAFLVPQGPSGKLLDRIVKSRKALRLVISPKIRDELEFTLLRLDFMLEEALEYSNFMLRLDQYVIPKRIEGVTSHDPDNYILATAYEGKAHYLVTRDAKHLLPLKRYKGVAILSPREFLDTFATA